MDLMALSSELTVDPLARGYSGMTYAEIVTSLNTKNRTRVLDTLSSAQIYEAIVPSEFQALTDAQRLLIRDVFGLGNSVQVGPSTNARSVLVGILGGGSDSITALAALLEETISRATELGLGIVTEGDIIKAEAYPA